ncbi:putative small multidrug efflux protein [Paenibacillus algicola]|uniref:Putative small multidrug efflux protein n=1 Tax=Paenibacillus algicola TaxID=2565926 RepID=A0A4V1G457_9BACL|nr:MULTISPECIES: small multi-drug export protein [Paenibacillus]QCT03534.1 putative small multidrug efflux protein [Paenibacillus algicola]
MDFFGEAWQYILVFLMGAVPWIEIAAVIPLGILAGLNPVLTGTMAFLGNLATVYGLVVFFDKIRQWRAAKKEALGKPNKKSDRAIALWNKYGLPGLSLLGPLLIGSHIAIFIAIVFGAKKHLALIWMTISLALWSLVFTLASMYGVDWFQSFRG